MESNEQRWLLIMNDVINRIAEMSELNRHEVIDGMLASLEYLHAVETAKIVGMN